MSSFNWFVGGPLIYFAVAFFIFKTVTTVIKYFRMPRHLRWDLYPVPHQGPEGSKYQKVDFGKLKSHASLFYELREMIPEMLFIKKAFINNPKVWAGSFPLHAGFYLGMIWLVLIVAGALLELSSVRVTAASTSVISTTVYYLTIATGAGCFITGFCGSLVLLALRIGDRDMRYISDYVTFINLGLIIALFGAGLAAWGLTDSSFSIIRRHVSDLLIINLVPVKEPLVVIEMLVFCLFLIYLPFSRMMHFVGKYFFYHNIMWDDEMMKRNSAMENDIASYLHFKTTWSAPHMRKDGTWVDQVVEGPPKEGEHK